MAYPDYQTPNLASVLQTLAVYAPPPPQPPLQQHPLQPYKQQPQPDLEEGEYDPSDFQPSLNLHPQPLQPPLPSQTQHPPPSQPPSQPPSLHPHPIPQPSFTPVNPPPKPPAPPTNITTWPPALRYTTTLLTNSPHIAPRIRHLIHTAHNHERQWWSGREALLARLASRRENKRKLDDVLRSVGGGVCGRVVIGEKGAGADKEGEEREPGKEKWEGGKEEGDKDNMEKEKEEELRVYDKKVYKAYGEMVKATREELGKMGIPFFIDGAGDEGGKGNNMGEEELERLRGRMMDFLEDMVRE